jgi:hypothetical protein
VIELAIRTGQPISEVEALGPRGWATMVDLLTPASDDSAELM